MSNTYIYENTCYSAYILAIALGIGKDITKSVEQEII